MDDKLINVVESQHVICFRRGLSDLRLDSVFVSSRPLVRNNAVINLSSLLSRNPVQERLSPFHNRHQSSIFTADPAPFPLQPRLLQRDALLPGDDLRIGILVRDDGRGDGERGSRGGFSPYPQLPAISATDDDDDDDDNNENADDSTQDNGTTDGTAATDGGDDCPICLDSIRRKQLCVTRCGHRYHKHCLREMMRHHVSTHKIQETLERDAGKSVNVT